MDEEGETWEAGATMLASGKKAALVAEYESTSVYSECAGRAAYRRFEHQLRTTASLRYVSIIDGSKNCRLGNVESIRNLLHGPREIRESGPYL